MATLYISYLCSYVGQVATPSSGVAKVIGMMLQIGMEQLDRLVTVQGVVQVRSGVSGAEVLEVEVEGVEGEVKVLSTAQTSFRELASLTLAAQPDVPPCLSQWKAFRKILLYTKGPNHQHLLQCLQRLLELIDHRASLLDSR